MRKPFSKWAAIGGASVAFYSLVASTAFALFLPQAKLQTLTFKTANLQLLVSGEQIDQPSLSSFQATAQFPGTDQLNPGGEAIEEDFWVRNGSSPNQILRLSGQLSAGNQDWSMLQHVIQAKLSVYGSSEETPWLSLGEWAAQEHDFPGDRLWDDTRRRYQFSYRLLENYPIDPDGAGPLEIGSPIGHELMNKQTGGLVFTVDGRRE